MRKNLQLKMSSLPCEVINKMKRLLAKTAAVEPIISS